MNDDDIWIVNPDKYEDRCIAVRSKTAYIYCYPLNYDILATGAKVITRDGRTVKKVVLEPSGYTGLLEGKEEHWDIAGRYIDAYRDSPNDLYIPERFFRKDWQTTIRMSNAEYAIRYGRRHPKAKIQRNQ